jgi:hypothetical protein
MLGVPSVRPAQARSVVVERLAISKKTWVWLGESCSRRFDAPELGRPEEAS